MTSIYMKRRLASLIRYMQIKTTMRINPMLCRMAFIRKIHKNFGKDVKKEEPSYTVGRNVN